MKCEQVGDCHADATFVIWPNEATHGHPIPSCYEHCHNHHTPGPSTWTVRPVDENSAAEIAKNADDWALIEWRKKHIG